jgi:dynein heavy chain
LVWLLLQAARLWIHEVERVFRDRMVSDTDMNKFNEFKTGTVKKYFEDLGMAALEEAPLLFTSFMQVGGTATCMQFRLVCKHKTTSLLNRLKPALPALSLNDVGRRCLL